jgi:hypothetical protein
LTTVQYEARQSKYNNNNSIMTTVQCEASPDVSQTYRTQFSAITASRLDMQFGDCTISLTRRGTESCKQSHPQLWCSVLFLTFLLYSPRTNKRPFATISPQSCH